MKNTPLYRVVIRNPATGEESFPSRYEVGTKVYSLKSAALAAANKLNKRYENYKTLEAVVYETEAYWREVPLDKSLEV